jgi:hypothetical protein
MAFCILNGRCREAAEGVSSQINNPLERSIGIVVNFTVFLRL